MIFGGGALGRRFGHESRALMNGTAVLIKETLRATLSSSSYKDTAERQLSITEEFGFHQTPSLDLGLSRL